jgi:hypothetical protein
MQSETKHELRIEESITIRHEVRFKHRNLHPLANSTRTLKAILKWFWALCITTLRLGS